MFYFYFQCNFDANASSRCRCRWRLCTIFLIQFSCWSMHRLASTVGWLWLNDTFSFRTVANLYVGIGNNYWIYTNFKHETQQSLNCNIAPTYINSMVTRNRRQKWKQIELHTNRISVERLLFSPLFKIHCLQYTVCILTHSSFFFIELNNVLVFIVQMKSYCVHYLCECGLVSVQNYVFYKKKQQKMMMKKKKTIKSNDSSAIETATIFIAFQRFERPTFFLVLLKKNCSQRNTNTSLNGLSAQLAYIRAQFIDIGEIGNSNFRL